MLTKNKKLTLTVLLGSALLLLIAVSIASAHGWGRSNRMGMHNMQNWNSQLPMEYSLDSNQMNKVNTILDECYDNMMPLNRKLSSLRMEMQGYSNRPDADLARVKSYRNQIRDLEDEINDLRFSANKQIDKMLSDDQRDYFGSNYDWCDFGFDYENMNGMHMGNMNDMCTDNWHDCDMHTSLTDNNNRYSNNWTGCCW